MELLIQGFFGRDLDRISFRVSEMIALTTGDDLHQLGF